MDWTSLGELLNQHTKYGVLGIQREDQQRLQGKGEYRKLCSYYDAWAIILRV